MKFGLIGLGRMGANLAQNAAEKGHEIIAYNRTTQKADDLAQTQGITAAHTIEELFRNMTTPRIIWLMVPAGKPVDSMLEQISSYLEKEDIVVDGGNSFYKDSKRRAETLAGIGVKYLDIGVSGGISGARNGACMMAGGDKDAYQTIEPLITSVCVTEGCGYMGPSGAGHFIKMVHNGIEYGMMQALGEGYQLLDKAEYNFSYEDVSRVWANGSVIRGWLVELLQQQFSSDPQLTTIPSKVGQSGEGLWTLQEGLDHGVAMPAISSAIFKRFESQDESLFSTKVIQALRKGFGGHDANNHLPE